MSGFSSYASQEEVDELLDFVASLDCDGNSNTNNEEPPNEEVACLYAIKQFALNNELELTKPEILLLKSVDPCGSAGFDEEDAFCKLIKKRFESSCSEEYNMAIDEIIANGNCNQEDFKEAYNAYFGIKEIVDDQTGFPTLNVGDVLCPVVFNINSAQDGIHISTGIQDFRFQVTNVNGQVFTIYHPYIQVLVGQDLSQCPGMTHSAIVATAFNQAVNQYRALMATVVSPNQLNAITQNFHNLVSANIENLTAGCSNNGSSTGVHATNSVGAYEQACNTVFTQLNQTHINGC